MNHLLFDNARINVWFISYQQIWCLLFCSGIFCVHRLCRLYREAFALLCFMWVGILAVLSTQLHRLRCLHPCNAKCYAQPLLSPDNSLIFRFHLHCHFLIHPEVMPPTPGQHIAALQQVWKCLSFHRKPLKAWCREVCPERSALNEFVAQRVNHFPNCIIKKRHTEKKRKDILTKWIAWMHCKSLWIKASAKCINK